MWYRDMVVGVGEGWQDGTEGPLFSQGDFWGGELSGRWPHVMEEDGLGGAASMWDAEVSHPRMTTPGHRVETGGESGCGEASHGPMVLDGLLRDMSERK
jgi:hypothetical protein